MLISPPDLPNVILALYPTFLAPNDTVTTVSNGGFIKFCGFDRVLIDTWTSIYFKHKSGFEFTLPLQPRNTIDYIKFYVHPSTKHSRSYSLHSSHSSSKWGAQSASTTRIHGAVSSSHPPQFNHLSLQPVSTHHRSLRGSIELSWRLHTKYGHRSLATLQHMISKDLIDGIPKDTKLIDLPFRCPICDAAGATLLRRGRLVDTSKLPVGSLFHIDFTFWNTVSIRGFHAALIIVEATTRYMWFFPCRHKNPPIDLCLFFFDWLKRHGLPVLRIRCDEDGAFIRCTEFCKVMLESLGIPLQSTGGYASSINGKAEAPNFPFVVFTLR